MRALKLSGLAGVMLALAVFLLWPKAEPVKRKNHHLRYSFEIKNPSAQALTDVSFSVFSPLFNSPFQNVVNIDASRNFTKTGVEKTGEMLGFTYPLIPPYGTKQVSITAQLTSGADAQTVVDEDIAQYLKNSTLLNLNSPVVQKHVARFVADNSTPQQVSHWLHNNIKYSGYIAEDRGAEYALREGKGDCTEYSNAFVAIMRAMKIPARVVAGFMVAGNTSLLKSGNYHNWAEYFDGDRWVVIDPQYDRGASEKISYIAFRYLGDESAVGKTNSHRFLSFDPVLQVAMK